MSGTNLFAPEYASSTAVQIALNDELGNAILVKCPTGNIPSAVAGYAIGCILIDETTGITYSNTGTASSCTFTAINTDTAGNIALAYGSVIVGNSSGVGAAVDTKTAGNFILGNGTTATSVNLNALTYNIANVITETTATPGNTAATKSIYGKHVAFSTNTNATLLGVRGEFNMPNSSSMSTGTFGYGTQGKVVCGTGTTIDVGSGHIAGVLGQLDISGATTTSGHIAPVISSIQDSSGTARTAVNGFYAELPAYGSGALMNSVLQGVGAANYGLDLGGIGGMTKLVTMPSSVAGASDGSGALVYIEVLINGVAARLAARYVA